MLLRGAYLLAGFVSQGAVFVVCLVSRGASWTVGFVALGVERTVGLVSRGVDRTSGLAVEARGTVVRLWGGVGVEQAVTAVAELPENTWSAVRSYLARVDSAARCRTAYHRFTRPLSARYRDIKKRG